ncbi:MerR family transcriptional regulator [Nocardia flavorosea]|uniref:MerR family transcriptional regulator n=1 Tax=Nocardia flavorosea TaxID=53429 RepID=A0A846YF18_9NOCA|nr:MerR family transcriptional regulator [Nocardia flavorosea]NKY57487.1 MerR family transcriptional regulator [Nocardia flavorosea]
MSSLLRIGEFATRAEVSPRTVDYYTSLGLLTPADRTTGGYRLYDDADIVRVHLIRQLEAQGLSLEEITTALTSGTGDISDALARLDDDLKLLHTVAETAPSEVHGLLTLISARVHSLITVALQIPPDIPIM